jgi:ATP-dependent 26S proteasome regulatory subunit
LTKKYLAKYFGDILSQKKVNSLAKSCVSEKLTYAQLQEVYFNSVFISINSGRDVVSNDDVDQALSEVLNEKEIAAKGFIYGAEVSDEENDSL